MTTLLMFMLMADVRVSMSPQGAEALKALTGKRVPGVQIVAVTTCSDAAVAISGGALYQAAAGAGIATISARLAPAIIARSVDRNWKKITVDVIGAASGIAAGWAPAGAATALIAGHLVGDQVSGFLRPRIPDPSVLLTGLIDASARFDVDAGGCREGFMLAAFRKNAAPIVLKLSSGGTNE
jgi:hypothetical protein